jgi:hypothetical protein
MGRGQIQRLFLATARGQKCGWTRRLGILAEVNVFLLWDDNDSVRPLCRCGSRSFFTTTTGRHDDLHRRLAAVANTQRDGRPSLLKESGERSGGERIDGGSKANERPMSRIGHKERSKLDLD